MQINLQKEIMGSPQKQFKRVAVKMCELFLFVILLQIVNDDIANEIRKSRTHVTLVR